MAWARGGRRQRALAPHVHASHAPLARARGPLADAHVGPWPQVRGKFEERLRKATPPRPAPAPPPAKPTGGEDLAGGELVPSSVMDRRLREVGARMHGRPAEARMHEARIPAAYLMPHLVAPLTRRPVTPTCIAPIASPASRYVRSTRQKSTASVRRWQQRCTTESSCKTSWPPPRSARPRARVPACPRARSELC